MTNPFTESRIRQDMHRYLGSLEHAISLAAHYHLGQLDKAGLPYIEHVIQVVAMVEGTDTKTVAALHDIVEDTPMTIDGLLAAGFTGPVVNAVDALTRRPGEDYMTEYIARVTTNIVAVEVKMADLLHNMDISRLSHEPTENDYIRLDKYTRAYKLLLRVQEWQERMMPKRES